MNDSKYASIGGRVHRQMPLMHAEHVGKKGAYTKVICVSPPGR